MATPADLVFQSANVFAWLDNAVITVQISYLEVPASARVLPVPSPPAQQATAVAMPARSILASLPER